MRRGVSDENDREVVPYWFEIEGEKCRLMTKI